MTYPNAQPPALSLGRANALYQPKDADLTALAALSGTGFAKRTGSNTWAVAALEAADIPSLAASIITSGQLALARGGTNADLSATGGTGQFLRQSSAGAAVTVSGIVSADLTTALTTPPAIGGTTPAAITGTTLASVVNTTSFVGVSAQNTNAAGTSSVLLLNPSGSTIGYFRYYGASFSVGEGLPGQTGFGSTSGVIVMSDAGLANGGTNTIQFRAGGYTASQERMRISTSGVGIGTAANASTRLHVLESTANTVTPANVVTIGANSTGTAGAGFGAGLLWTLESSTTENQNAALDEALWSVATHASRMGRRRLGVYDVSTPRYGIDMVAVSGAVQLGFFGATPVSRATGYTAFANLSTDRTLDANATTIDEVADVLGTLIEDLKSLGLIAA